MLRTIEYSLVVFVFLVWMQPVIIPHILFAGETGEPDKPGKVFFRDDFTGRSLRPEWVLQNADSDRFSLETGHLVLISTDREKGIKNELIFSQKIPENCEVIVKFNSRLDSDASIGLGLYRDKDNYISLRRARVTGLVYGGGGPHRLVFSKSLRGESSEITKAFQQLPKEMYLKITNNNLEYTGYYSFDGTTWSEVGQQFFKNLNGRPSLAVYNHEPKAPEVAVQLDYFEIKMLE
jgi:beta-xylosidase